MLENLYTTKMSMDKKKLQNRFTKIRSQSGRISKTMALFMTLFIGVTMLCATVVMAALDNVEKELITLYSNGEIIELQNKPFIKDNMTYLPLRETFEKLGVFEIQGNELNWDNGTIHIKVAEDADKEAVYYTISINSDMIKVSHNEEKGVRNLVTGLTVKPAENTPVLLIGDKTYVPYIFIDYMLNRGMGIKNDVEKFDFMFTVNVQTPTAFVSQGFIMPCEGEISNSYGERVHPITKEIKKHNGVDIVAPEGTDVVSAIYGTVTEIGFDAEKGNYIIIEKDNIKTVYSQLMQEISVTEGDNVIRGQVIGKVGTTGMSTGAHLHFEILINNEYYNPELIG